MKMMDERNSAVAVNMSLSRERK